MGVWDLCEHRQAMCVASKQGCQQMCAQSMGCLRSSKCIVCEHTVYASLHAVAIVTEADYAGQFSATNSSCVRPTLSSAGWLSARAHDVHQLPNHLHL